MKVAIIGANGFIGNRLVERFHFSGLYEPVSIVRQPASLALPARLGSEWRVGDALDAGSLAKALNGCDAVVHAAIGDPRQIEKMPAVLRAAAAAADISRVIYLSSASVHGQNPPQGSTEEAPLHRKHSLDYNNAKVAAEQTFFAEAEKRGLAAFALRPGVVYGPRSRWIADLATDLLKGRAWLYDGGSGICNGIYVDNLIAAIELCLEAPAEAGGAYLVGDEETITWSEFYQSVADGLGVSRERIHALSELPVFRKSIRERIEKTMTEPWLQALLPAVPGTWKQTAKRVLISCQTSNGTNAWALPRAAAPRITEELALLQLCRCKLPHAKAAQALGYRAPIPFFEAMSRSLCWLRFAMGGAIP